jgi:hypothetical protein
MTSMQPTVGRKNQNRRRGPPYLTTSARMPPSGPHSFRIRSIALFSLSLHKLQMAAPEGGARGGEGRGNGAPRR